MVRNELDFSRDLINKASLRGGPNFEQNIIVPQPNYKSNISLPSIIELGLTTNSRAIPSSPGHLNQDYYIDYYPPTYYFPPSTYYPNPSFPYHYMPMDPYKAFYMGVRRHRVTSAQKDVLNKVFKQSFFPSTDTRNKLAQELGMTPRTVQIWFQNKRQAWRTKHKTSSHHPTQVPEDFDDSDPEYLADYSFEF